MSAAAIGRDWLASPALDAVYGGNTLRAYLVAFLIAAGILAAIKLYAVFLGRRLRRIAATTHTQTDDFLLDLLDRAGTPILLVLAAHVLTRTLVTPVILQKTMHLVLVVVVIYYAITSFTRFIDAVLARAAEVKERRIDPHALHNMRIIVRIVAWTLGALLALRNLGYDVTSLLAGMGIAGIAVALAVQNILGDLFSYVSILVDKPFEIGDFIIVDSDMGTVETIGIRSTRIRTLTGQVLVVSNADLTSSRINNFKKMERRRVTFTIGVVYGTPPDKLRAIPEWIGRIVSGNPALTLDRVTFKSFGASSLDFEIVYFISNADFNAYMLAQQRINLEIYEKFLAEGVDFAFPTQTVVLKSGGEAGRSPAPAPRA